MKSMIDANAQFRAVVASCAPELLAIEHVAPDAWRELRESYEREFEESSVSQRETKRALRLVVSND